MISSRAIIVSRNGGIEVLELLKRDVPAPTGSQLRIRVQAAGVNPVDTYIRSATQGYAPALPYTPGSDCAGVVDAAGPSAAFAPGQRVYVSLPLSPYGSYAEYTLCESEHAHVLPERLTFAQGCAVPVPYATAYRALALRARARPGEAVLVHGASGGVGVAALQTARAMGCRVLGTAGSAEGLALVAQYADEAINHRSADYDQPLEGKFDVIVEMLADANLGRDLRMLRPGGRVAVVGSRGRVEVAPRELMRCEGAVLGVALRRADAKEARETMAFVQAGLERGGLAPVVDREFRMLRGEAGEAHRYVIEKEASKGKVVLLIE